MKFIENWRNIEEYPNYQVSDQGRVKSLNYNLTLWEHILEPWKDNGYLRVYLCKDGERKKEYIHRLVANAFIPNPKNLPCVNHKDENKENNCVDNLEWCTYKYNNNYGTHNERSAKAKSKPVGQYTLDGTLVKVWKSTMEVGRNGYNQRNVSSCCSGKRNTHKGYLWKYVS